MKSNDENLEKIGVDNIILMDVSNTYVWNKGQKHSLKIKVG